MRKDQDTQESADPFVRARLYQTALGLAFAVLGVVALCLGHPAHGGSLLALGMWLVPTKTLRVSP